PESMQRCQRLKRRQSAPGAAQHMLEFARDEIQGQRGRRSQTPGKEPRNVAAFGHHRAPQQAWEFDLFNLFPKPLGWLPWHRAFLGCILTRSVSEGAREL